MPTSSLGDRGSWDSVVKKELLISQDMSPEMLDRQSGLPWASQEHLREGLFFLMELRQPDCVGVPLHNFLCFAV